MPYGQFTKAPHLLDRSNRGIEGLCLTDKHLYVATEPSINLSQGTRFAALARYDFTTKEWTPFYIPLGTRDGKVSALSCRQNPSQSTTEVYAIERHYSISQILKFSVPDKLEPEEQIDAHLMLDLAPLFKTKPNLEGLVVLSPTHFALISDNQSSVVQGSTVWFEMINKAENEHP
jgi:hypothetical protein